MTDPLDDPRALDLLAAVPEDVTTLAGGFGAAAGQSAMTATGLRAARSDGTWSGHAADGFRHAIGQIPHELDHVRAGYAAVAAALTAYEPELARLQAAFVQVIAQLNDVGAHLGRAQTSVQQTRRALLALNRGQPDRRTFAEAELAAARADGVRDGYEHEIVRLTARARALLDEFSTARSACRAAVAVAQRTAPVRPRPSQGTTIVVHEFRPRAEYLASFNSVLHPAGL